MKHSVAKKVTWRVLLLLLLAFVLLFVGSFFLVRYVVYSENERYAETVLGLYSDLVTGAYSDAHIPIDEEHYEIANKYSEYICKWYGVDYAYIYKPDVEKNEVRYICAARDPSNPNTRIEKEMKGKSLPYIFSEQEKGVWDEELMFGHFSIDNTFGHEIATVILIEDSFGNRLIAGVDIGFSEVLEKVLGVFAIAALLIVLVLLGIYFSVSLIVKKSISDPAQIISKRMTDFITDGRRSTEKLQMPGDDEFAMIASAFNSMTDDIDSYLKDIHTLSREQERQSAELDIASRIQKGFLPQKAVCEPGYEIRALMQAAKNVGGDLYDYFALDENRTVIAIGDASGKGISAAMFMSYTLVLIRHFAKLNLSPAEILRRTNDNLTLNNAGMLFTTVFVGIYDKKTETLTYSNAGHNRPYILGDGLRVLDGACGTLLGLYEDEEYEDAAVQLKPGQTIFLYTDGVNEATDSQKHFYGMKRLEDELQQFGTSEEKDLTKYIESSVMDFTAGAEQHDDMTMLALTVCDVKELLLDFDLHEMEKIKKTVLSLPLARQQQLNLCLAAEEIFVNIVSYAFPDGAPEGEKIRFRIRATDKVVMSFEDGGMPYNPLKEVNAPDDYDIDTQIGGLGKFISFSLSDDVSYEYRRNKNCLRIIKNIEEEEK